MRKNIMSKMVVLVIALILCITEVLPTTAFAAEVTATKETALQPLIYTFTEGEYQLTQASSANNSTVL